MNKSELKTGMMVTTRREGTYFVMRDTCASKADQKDVLVHQYPRCESLGWMPLSEYDDDLNHIGGEDFFGEMIGPDPDFDIVKVSYVSRVADMFKERRYDVIWTRGD